MKGGISKGLMPNICGRRQSVENEFSVKVSCCEIYNKEILDLLDSNMLFDSNMRRSLHIREDVKHKSFFVEHLSAKTCLSAADCLKMLDVATVNRQTESTQMNKTSSRSHLVFSVLITRRKMLELKDREGSLSSRARRGSTWWTWPARSGSASAAPLPPGSRRLSTSTRA